MTPETWQITGFTVAVSLASTLLILPLGIPLAWLLARREWTGKSLVETLVSLPLVIPPVATGLILLKLFGRRGPVGSFLEHDLGLQIVFTWKAVVIACAVMSFPLLVRAARIAFEEVPPRLENVALTLGASPLRVFFRITLPLAMKGVWAGALLAFARALGEFGATIVVAGNIPGKTSTLSLSIYNEIQFGRDGAAFALLGISILLAFSSVWLSECLLKKQHRRIQ